MTNYDVCLRRLRCQCGCGKFIDSTFLSFFKKLYEAMGGDLDIVSGARCPSRNALAGGTEGSLHTKGKAIDCGCRSAGYQQKLYDVARLIGFTGFGWRRRALHIDTGPPRQWTYDAAGTRIPKDPTPAV